MMQEVLKVGCDIHYVVEKRHGDRWVGLFRKYPKPDGALAANRNYAVFAELAGVRGRTSTSHEERGVPDDASELARMEIDRDGPDGHSHSWLTLQEYSAAFVRGMRRDAEDFRSTPQSKWAEEIDQLVVKLGDPFSRWDRLFGLCPFSVYEETENEADRIENYRIVFWFDN